MIPPSVDLVVLVQQARIEVIMYICGNCDDTFIEPDYIMDGEEEWAVCPNCHSDMYEEAVECCECGCYMSKCNAWLDDNLDWYCESCKEEGGLS